MSGELKEAVGKFRSRNSELKTLQRLKDLLVEEMDDFDLGDSDTNEHKLNMIIRNLEEDLDRIESEKLHDWNPEED
ncbi:MAG: hypothetical protein ABEK10_03375 [Candidatus Nanosalina sp.]